MKKFPISALLAVAVFSSLPVSAFASKSVGELFQERIHSIVAVEYFIETEIERQPGSELGIVANDEGLIVLLDYAVPAWVPVDRLKEFKVVPLLSRTKYHAEYLGRDPLTGWHYLRVADEELRDQLVPVTAYETVKPAMGDEVWGIAVMDEDFDYEPYFLSSRLSMFRELPQEIGLTVAEVASPGALIFSRDGALVGWAGLSYVRERMLYMGERRLPISIQGIRESGLFLPPHEFLPYIDRVPESPEDSTTPWLGVTNLQSIERDLAEFLGIEDRSGIILGEIVEGGPADEGDLVKGDIIIGVNGEPIPYYRPRDVAYEYLQREILKSSPGDTIRLTLLRGTEKMEKEVTIGVQPTTLREAERTYFPDMGLTAREFLIFDGIARRIGPERDRGLIVQFVRPNSPAFTAGLQVGDWIKEVEGVPVSTYPEAIEQVAEATSNDRGEAVFLISRQNETSVVRVRLR